MVKFIYIVLPHTVHSGSVNSSSFRFLPKQEEILALMAEMQ